MLLEVASHCFVDVVVDGILVVLAAILYLSMKQVFRANRFSDLPDLFGCHG